MASLRSIRITESEWARGVSFATAALCWQRMPRIRALAPKLNVAEGMFRAGPGLHLPVRMVAIQLDAGVLVWGPIPLDAALAADVAALGDVRWIAAPNRFHHLSLPPWPARFPGARLLGAPGLADKRKDLTFEGMLDERHEFGDEVRLLPVAGAPRASEVCLLHVPSLTLVCTDLVFHVREAPLLTRLILKWLSGAYGTVAQSRLWKRLITDRAAAAASARRILDADWDRLVMSHGDVVETGGKAALEAALAWMLAGAERGANASGAGSR